MAGTIPGGRHARTGVGLGFADGHVWEHWPKERGDCTDPQDLDDLPWLQRRFVEPFVDPKT